MSWMEWLDAESRSKLQLNLNTILADELSKRHWGFHKAADGNSINKYIITDLRGLNFASGLIRYTLKDANVRVIYRGQDKDYPLLPSLYRSCSSPEEMDILEKRLDRVLDIISADFYPSGTAEERELVCQHYGMPTRYLDVADNLQTALWFAYDRTTVQKGREVSADDDYGCINILAVPNDINKLKIIDLRNQSPEFLRIHTQQAFAMKKTNPGENMGLFTSYITAKFMIPRELLRLWSNHDNIPYEFMFPPKSLDKGLVYWEALNSKLKKENIEIEKYLRLNTK